MHSCVAIMITRCGFSTIHYLATITRSLDSGKTKFLCHAGTRHNLTRLYSIQCATVSHTDVATEYRWVPHTHGHTSAHARTHARYRLREL